MNDLRAGGAPEVKIYNPSSQRKKARGNPHVPDWTRQVARSTVTDGGGEMKRSDQKKLELETGVNPATQAHPSSIRLVFSVFSTLSRIFFEGFFSARALFMYFFFILFVLFMSSFLVVRSRSSFLVFEHFFKLNYFFLHHFLLAILWCDPPTSGRPVPPLSLFHCSVQFIFRLALVWLW